MPKEQSGPSSLLDRAATMAVDAYNPRVVIEAVNALQSLAEKKAWAQIDSYLASRDKKKVIHGLFWVLRVLFDVPAGESFPPVRIGAPAIPPPADPAKLPRFPIVMVSDVPFLAVDKYFLGGKAEPVEVHVAYYRAHGVFRAQPLAPPPSLAGVEEALLQTWKAAYGEAYVPQVMETVRAQIARMRANNKSG